MSTLPFDDLLRQAAALAGDPFFRQALVRCMDGSDARIEQADRLTVGIHPDDQMFLHSLHAHQDSGAALSQYFNIGVQQYRSVRQAVETLFGERADTVTILDFACGFGRLLRFLTLDWPKASITGSEIQPEALDFVSAALGVHTLPSTAHPDNFEVAQCFDVIWVASLFSHLPDELFGPWLARLLSLLNPGGVLCFSVRGESQFAGGRIAEAEGILYQQDSELSPLDKRLYGTAYVTDGYVRARLAEAAGAATRHVRLPRALANEQDLYVVSADGRRDPAVLAGSFLRGPWGWVDVRRREADGSVYLEGWAASLDEEVRLDCVEVTLAGTAHEVPINIPRPDVAEAFQAPHMLCSGWRLRVPSGTGGVPLRIQVMAHTPRGAALLYYGLLS
ncbi:MAG: class I SAM-dependent methyltransferase [Lysobacteraceae bacterium]